MANNTGFTLSFEALSAVSVAVQHYAYDQKDKGHAFTAARYLDIFADMEDHAGHSERATDARAQAADMRAVKRAATVAAG